MLNVNPALFDPPRVEKIHESGNKLIPEEKRRLEKSGAGQREKILEYFKDHPNKNYSCEEILKYLSLKCPLTSVRRAMSNLAKEGLIIKDEGVRRVSEFGISCVTFKYVK